MAAGRFLWNDWNIEHIGRHGVSPWEVEQVLERPRFERAGRRGAKLAYGQSYSGRYLLVVYRSLRQGGIFVITSRDLSRGEKQDLKRRRRP